MRKTKRKGGTRPPFFFQNVSISRSGCLSLKRPVIQVVIAAAALREHDVHAVPDERVRRYPKLGRIPSCPVLWGWELTIFCGPGRMLVCRVLHERVSTSGECQC